DRDREIAQHYAHGTLEAAILGALAASGEDPDKLTVADLAPVDEFHIGGRQATMDLAAQLDLPRGARVLDVGCGLGGPSRYFAQDRGWRVDGIDLTPEYVEVAERLSRRVGLGEAVSYRQASALALPFANRTFDGAYMLHVGMNIADKKTAFAEVHRVLKPGGTFAIYDVMRESDGAFAYPVPWSSAPETNFIATAELYRQELRAAGFGIEKERSRRDFALEFFTRMRQRMAASGPPALGLQIVMGATAPQKVANMIGMLERGLFAPTEIIARAM
ncbi:MAG: methyltransferase domain-containing protein, partial [Alphaproteobacteria bacterium]|nr:methyltransferase domain-containing protein [Alphaproteobacteria bacterium]